MNKIPFFNLIITLLGVIAMYSPRFQLKMSKSLTGKELSRKYPEHGWMRWGFIVLYIAWIVLMFMFCSKVLYWVAAISFIGYLFASIGLFYGLFAIITGVCILPMHVPWLLYVVGDDARKAGRFQVFLSLSVVIVVSAIEVLRR